MAVYIKDGIVTDYSVQVSDAQGSFVVWASNLQRALDYQARYGSTGEFGLRNYALDLDNLRDADNSDDSLIKARIITLDQLKFATRSTESSSGGAEWSRPRNAANALVYTAADRRDVNS